MISVDEALRRIMSAARPRAPRRLPVEAAVNHALAETVYCTGDSPPHDKSLVDGYALRSGDLLGRDFLGGSPLGNAGLPGPPGMSGVTNAANASSNVTVLRVLEEVTAGQVPTVVVEQGTATRIMTGAPIPAGADSVVMIERTELADDAAGVPRVRIHDRAVRPGQNIMRRGESMRRGDPVLSPGHRLRAIESGLLAELGRREVTVFPRPTVAVLSTGNELVPAGTEPATGQIRNSNGPMLEQLVAEAGCEPRPLGIARDTADELRPYVAAGLHSDVLLISGGVSAGVLDLVPDVLQQLGVQQVFHKVHLKPGKPVWFGVLAGGDQADKLVFGLPGNPVSSLVCFHLFVRPALVQLSGIAAAAIAQVTARLTREHQHRSDRPTFHPGRAREESGELFVEPLNWRGSADLRTLVDANVLIYFPEGTGTHRSGDVVAVRLL